MTRIEKKQGRQMRWILFYVFVAIFVAVVAGTYLAVFTNLVDVSEEYENTLFKVFIIEVGFAVVTLFLVIFNLKKKPVEDVEQKPVPKVDGKYKYEVFCSDKKTTFQGECLVKQDGRALAFNGERQKECIGIRKKKVSFHWFSHWAEFCVDNKVRLDFSLTDSNGGTRGYAVLLVNSGKAKKMRGELYLFGNSYMYGTVKYMKM